ncbi:hypothetical protein ANN_01510 [Periplaneta americana]|uniref:Uncharacterized protein n=1 Tax=Periplaneta americana TaxID=6978 RepID=A0ABQ8TTS1_PERAM|nr:hypothetical protein ANN_01510 [Periplaneta americana]
MGGVILGGGRRIKCLRFANDMALLANEEMILRDMLLVLNDSCEQNFECDATSGRGGGGFGGGGGDSDGGGRGSSRGGSGSGSALKYVKDILRFKEEISLKLNKRGDFSIDGSVDGSGSGSGSGSGGGGGGGGGSGSGSGSTSSSCSSEETLVIVVLVVKKN